MATYARAAATVLPDGGVGLSWATRPGPTTDERDDRLALQCKRGDMTAFDELYRRHFDEVYAYARIMTRDPYRAEDIAQEVFTKVLRCIGRYEVRPGVPFRAWLFRTARNTLIDAQRVAVRTSFADPEEIHRLRDAEVRWDPPPALRWASDSEIAIMVRRLSPPQRDVLTLRYLLDLRTEEIALVMNRTPKAVRRLQERALGTLEEWMSSLHAKRERRLQRVPMLLRIRPAPIMAARRFALAYTRPARWR